jgi:hypothetical protein
MKNIGMILLAVIMPLFAACGGNKVLVGSEGQFVQATPFKNLPEEAAGTLLTGVGTSEQRANFTLMREAALTSAQADLSRKVRTTGAAIWKRTMNDLGEYKKQGYDEATSNEEMKNMVTAMTDIDLRGPWQTQELVDKASGRYWVRIIYSEATVEKLTTQRMNNENILKKYFIESQIKRVQDDLQKDLDSARQKETADKAKIAELVK